MGDLFVFRGVPRRLSHRTHIYGLPSSHSTRRISEFIGALSDVIDAQKALVKFNFKHVIIDISSTEQKLGFLLSCDTYLIFTLHHALCAYIYRIEIVIAIVRFVIKLLIK